VKVKRLTARLDLDGRTVAGRVGRHHDFRRWRGRLSSLGSFGQISLVNITAASSMELTCTTSAPAASLTL
jgi:hypothetical protein